MSPTIVLIIIIAVLGVASPIVVKLINRKNAVHEVQEPVDGKKLTASGSGLNNKDKAASLVEEAKKAIGEAEKILSTEGRINTEKENIWKFTYKPLFLSLSETSMKSMKRTPSYKELDELRTKLFEIESNLGEQIAEHNKKVKD